MASSVYTINKGINQPVEFKGLKAQWIWYLGGALTALLVLFALLYIVGINGFICLGIIGVLGTGAFIRVYRLSNTYGAFGLMKKAAKRAVPRIIKCNSRTIFFSTRRHGQTTS